MIKGDKMEDIALCRHGEIIINQNQISQFKEIIKSLLYYKTKPNKVEERSVVLRNTGDRKSVV